MTDEIVEESEVFMPEDESPAEARGDLAREQAANEAEAVVTITRDPWVIPTLIQTFPFPGVERRGRQWITNHDLTSEIAAKLSDLHPGGVFSPACGDENKKGCGKTTCYIVIPQYRDWLALNPWSAVLFRAAMAGTAAYGIDGNAFIPVRLCIACASARDGYRAGKKHPWDQNRLRQDILASEELTPAEKSAATAAFNNGFKNGAAIATEAAINKDKSRYRAKGAK